MIPADPYYSVCPRWFRAQNRMWGLTIDAFSEDYNAVLPKFWTPEQDALAQDWCDLRLWLHPPYERQDLADECVRRMLAWEPLRAVMLAPWENLSRWHYELSQAKHIKVELANRLGWFVAPGVEPLDASRITPLMLVHCG